MSKEEILVHKYSNGMTLVCEPLAEVQSAAFTFLCPGGVAADPPQRTGAASLLHELLFRGAGQLNNRALNEVLDNLGLHRSGGVSEAYCTFGGALLGDNLLEALKLHADILMRPQLTGKDFTPCKALALQNLDSLEDEPRQQISLLAREHFMPAPFGRPSVGKRADLTALTHDETVTYFRTLLGAEGTILAVAGKVDFDAVRAAVGELFGAWNGQTPASAEPQPVQTGMFHHSHEGAQVHVSVLYPSVTHTSEHYYAALAAAGVLSGGMGSRLFTEVREKRGLCYAVGAAHRIYGPYGAMQCYLGSTPQHAQEALDVTLTECTKLADGVEPAELDRAKVGLRASLIMEGESTSARAAGCARDIYFLGRVRTLEEIEQAIQAVTIDDVLAYAAAYRPRAFCVTTLGPAELQAPRQD